MKTKLLSIFLFTKAISFAQFSFVHITDLHVSSVASSVNTCDLNGLRAQCYLKEFAQISPKPAFVIATGDISNIGNSNPAMYSMLTQFLYPQSLTYPGPGAYSIDSAKTIPIYFTPGNHDYYTTLYPPGSLTQLNRVNKYAQSIAPDTDYAVTTDISVILFIRSGYDIPYWNEPDPTSPASSGLTSAQCSWINNELSINSGKRKIIVMHHPLVSVAGTNCDGSPFTPITILTSSAGSMTNNRTTFLNICESNNVDVVLSGHQHQNVVADRAGNIINENCTTCGTRYVQTGAAFNGCYRTISVDSSFITVSSPLQSCTSVAAVNELNNSFNVSIFPNPSNGIFNLEFGVMDGSAPHTTSIGLKDAQLCIYNALGENVYSEKIRNPQSVILNLDLPNGVYFMHLQTAQGAAIKKMFISR